MFFYWGFCWNRPASGKLYFEHLFWDSGSQRKHIQVFRSFQFYKSCFPSGSAAETCRHQKTSILNIYLGFWISTSFQYRHPLSSRRLDATRHSVIWAKAFYGIWLVGHACAVLCWGAAPLASSLLLLRILVLKIFQGIHDGFLDSQWILGFTIQFHK